MPIYEYKCEKCGHKFDVFQRIGEDGSNLECPICGEPKPDKLFSAFASAGADTTGAISGSSCGPGSFT